MWKQVLRKIQRRTNPLGLILMYHRVDIEGMDPWGLCVTPKNFAEQLEVIQKYANPIALEKLTTNIKSGKVIPKSIAITFDDGYVNNFTYAKPLLEKFNIPATFYITTGMINGTREYWWDELEQILLQPGELPNELLIDAAGVNHRWVLDKAVRYTDIDCKQDFHTKPWQSQKGTRLNFYHSVWQYLQTLSEDERSKLLHEIAQWANYTPSLRESHSPIKEMELQELGKNELFEIGAHTVKHPSLPTQNKLQQTQEILCSKETLEKVIQRPVVSFAYPHGEYSKETVDILKSSGFESACTTDESVLRLNQNVLELPRFQVEDWNGETFHKILHHQLSL